MFPFATGLLKYGIGNLITTQLTKRKKSVEIWGIVNFGTRQFMLVKMGVLALEKNFKSVQPYISINHTPNCFSYHFSGLLLTNWVLRWRTHSNNRAYELVAGRPSVGCIPDGHFQSFRRQVVLRSINSLRRFIDGQIV